MESKEIEVIKVVLGTGKEVFLRQPLIRDQDMALQLASTKTKDNPMLLVTHTQKELLRMLIVQVAGKDVSRQQAEKLDDLFTLGEYNQLSQAVGQLSGGQDMGEFRIEH